MGDLDTGRRGPELDPGAPIEERVDGGDGGERGRTVIDLRLPDVAERRAGVVHAGQPRLAVVPGLRGEVGMVAEPAIGEERQGGVGRREAVVRTVRQVQLERVDEVLGGTQEDGVVVGEGDGLHRLVTTLNDLTGYAQPGSLM